MRLVIIVPAHDAARELERSLPALIAACSGSEIIVVDDASGDDTAAVAAGAGVRVVRLSRRSGPAVARNHGARQSRGDVLLFVDADVVVAPGAVERVRRRFAIEPALAAVFGSYDARPAAPGVVSQFRNLLHHHVHQTARAEAQTFWAGLGAVRRSAFDAVGGFDEDPRRRAIEDVELGYRLVAAGHPIQLDKALCGTHLKRWSVATMVWTDLALRARPWARLVLETGRAPRDLNLALRQRASVALVAAATLLAPFAAWDPRLLVPLVALLAAVGLCQLPFYRFLARERGGGFALAAVPLHVLHLACAAADFAWAWLDLRLGTPGRASRNARAACAG